jgi:hypothetical protein
VRDRRFVPRADDDRHEPDDHRDDDDDEQPLHGDDDGDDDGDDHGDGDGDDDRDGDDGDDDDGHDHVDDDAHPVAAGHDSGDHGDDAQLQQLEWGSPLVGVAADWCRGRGAGGRDLRVRSLSRRSRSGGGSALRPVAGVVWRRDAAGVVRRRDAAGVVRRRDAAGQQHAASAPAPA